MQFLKNMGTAMKQNNSQPKNSYFSSLSLETQKQKSPTNPSKQNKKPKKQCPPKGFLPQKFALDFNPPCIILQYRDHQTNKLYHHKMKINKLKRYSSTKQTIDYLKKKHYHYFMAKVIDQAQVQRLIQKLKSGLVGRDQSHIQNVSEEEEDVEFDYEDDFSQN